MCRLPRPLNLLTSVSAIFCVATGVLRFVTYDFTKDDLVRIHGSKCSERFWLDTSQGRLSLTVWPIRNQPVRGPNYKNVAAYAVWRTQFPRPSKIGLFGISFESGPCIGTGVGGTVWMIGSTWSFALPYTIPIAALAIMPMRWLINSRRRRSSLAAGLCVGCGYDLLLCLDAARSAGKFRNVSNK